MTMRKSGRKSTSPYVYDRVAIKRVLETEGRDAALKLWPKLVVDPIARILGLAPIYRNTSSPWNVEWTCLLGTKPDMVLAGELGIPQSTVRRQRWMLGIRTFDNLLRQAAIRKVLAAISDVELAEPIDTLVAKYELPIGDLYRERKRRSIGGRSRRGRRQRHADPAAMRRVAIIALKKAFPRVPLAQISEVVGCTRERVRQILYLESATDHELAS